MSEIDFLEYKAVRFDEYQVHKSYCGERIRKRQICVCEKPDIPSWLKMRFKRLVLEKKLEKENEDLDHQK